MLSDDIRGQLIAAELHTRSGTGSVAEARDVLRRYIQALLDELQLVSVGPSDDSDYVSTLEHYAHGGTTIDIVRTVREAYVQSVLRAAQVRSPVSPGSPGSPSVVSDVKARLDAAEKENKDPALISALRSQYRHLLELESKKAKKALDDAVAAGASPEVIAPLKKASDEADTAAIAAGAKISRPSFVSEFLTAALLTAPAWLMLGWTFLRRKRIRG